jgi:serine protease AprX
MSIGVPGNNPYAITVGAVTDSYHPSEPSEYRLATFSSAGPTYEGFVKPEVVAMGGHVRAYAPDDGTLAQRFPQWVDAQYPDMTMSGTSQAAAVTSGVVALMLEANPLLSPNTVKCRLMDGARPAIRTDGMLAYTVFQQGSGLVNAQDAIYSTATNCANQGLNVAADLAGIQHFGGRANQDANGNFYIMAVASIAPWRRLVPNSMSRSQLLPAGFAVGVEAAASFCALAASASRLAASAVSAASSARLLRIS